ncbi:chorismate synthase domain protein, partial [Mycobacterium xenopi 4042]
GRVWAKGLRTGRCLHPTRFARQGACAPTAAPLPAGRIDRVLQPIGTERSLRAGQQRIIDIDLPAARARRESRTCAPHGKMGHVLRWTTAGESHGRALVAVLRAWVAGCRHVARHRPAAAPAAGLRRAPDEIRTRRRDRAGRRAARLHPGRPIAIEIANTEWPKWETVMAADPVDPAQLADRPATRR